MKNTLASLNLVKTLNCFQSEYMELDLSIQEALIEKQENQLLQENIRLKF